MPRDAFGTYTIPNTFVPGTVMDAGDVNANFVDVGNAITGSLPRDGRAPMTGQLQIIAGSEAEPGLAFAADTDTGLRYSSENELRIVTGGVDRFYVDSTGRAVALYGLDISGEIDLAAPILIATTSTSLLTLRRTENDATDRTAIEIQRGSGAGSKVRIGTIGDGKVWTTEVGRIVRVRTGEVGADAL